MRSDMYLFNHWGDCLLIVVVPRPGFPDEVNEQAPQHQVDDNEGYGEPQGHIVEVIEEIHLAQSLQFFSNDMALTQIAFLMRTSLINRIARKILKIRIKLAEFV